MKSMIHDIKQAIEAAENTDQRDQLINHLSRAYLYRDIDQCIELSDNLIRNRPNKDLISRRAYLNLGAAYLLKEDFTKALANYREAFKDCHDPYIQLRTFMALGYCYDKINMDQEAIYYQEQALSLATKLEDPSAIAAIFNNLANSYAQIKQYDLALSFLDQAMTLARDHKLSNIQAYLYVSLCRNQLMQGRVDQLDTYFYGIESLIDGDNEMWFVGITQCLKACYQLYLENYDLASVYFDIGLDILLTEDQAMYLGLSYREFIFSLIKLGLKSQANHHLQAFESYIKKKDDLLSRIAFYRTAVDLYSSTQDLKALSFYQMAYQEAKSEVISHLATFS